MNLERALIAKRLKADIAANALFTRHRVYERCAQVRGKRVHLTLLANLLGRSLLLMLLRCLHVRARVVMHFLMIIIIDVCTAAAAAIATEVMLLLMVVVVIVIVIVVVATTAFVERYIIRNFGLLARLILHRFQLIHTHQFAI